jgi:ATP-dependent 26S proteasome regulatory subunit
MVGMPFVSEIINEVRAGMPGIHILSDEYLRLDTIVSETAKSLGFFVKEWNIGAGQINSGSGGPIKKEENIRSIIQYLDDVTENGLENKLLYIKNAKIAMEGKHENIGRLQYVLLKIQKHFKGKACVMYCSEEKFIPPEFEKLVYFKRLPPPDPNELKAIIDGYFSKNRCDSEEDLKATFLTYCAGLTEETVLYLLSKIFSGDKKSLREEDLEIVRKVKEQNISKGGYIEMVPLKEDFDDIGGMDNIKNYLKRKKIIIDDIASALDNGLMPPKGVMLAGMPGCGKSLSAKAAAALFKMPLLRIDIGSLMGKYVGESENNLKNAFFIAEQTSPCVLWLDEIEKAFSGLNSDSGGGVTSRMFGSFLTWMQEKSGTIFVIVTANDMEPIPPELWRKGRFDEVFFVGLPNKIECEQILRISLQKIKNKDSDIDTVEIAGVLSQKGFSGADITALVNEAAECAFINNKKRLTGDDIMDTISEIVPLKEMLGKKITDYESKYKTFKLKPASSPFEDEEKVVESYKAGKVNSDELIKKASKLGMSKKVSSLFTVLEHKLETGSGVVKAIKIKKGDIVYVNYRAIEIETDCGNIRSIPIKKNGIVSEIGVSEGQKLEMGQTLFKVLVPIGGYINGSK